MTARSAVRLAWSAWALVILGFAVHFVPGFPGDIIPKGGNGGVAALAFGAFVLSFVTVGALVASRRPRIPIGWLLLSAAVAETVAGLGTSVAGHSGAHPPGLVVAADMIGGRLYLAGGSLGFVTLLLFPTGSLPSHRWRWVVWMIALGLVLLEVSDIFGRPRLQDLHVANPLAVSGAVGRILDSLQQAVLLVILGGVLAAASLVVRFRRVEGIERKQIEWLAYAAVIVLLGVVATTILQSMPQTAALNNLENGLLTAVLACIPIAMGFAILRRRLYDIDVVINKTIVFTLLAAFITSGYVGIVVGLGAALGDRGGRPNVALSILASAVIALGFGPLKERVQHLANRLVYGRRATPYEALSAFSERMGGAVAAEELLPTTARILAEGTGASQATVWLLVDGALEPGATWPSNAVPPEAVAMPEPDLPPLPGATLSLPVLDGGETLGALSLLKPRGERLAPVEETLARDLASQAGLVLRNVRLTRELLDRMEEIRASRARIVAAQDAERRRLERNIHDGAQQELVALAVKLRLAKTLIDRDAERSAAALRDVQAGATGALETLRDLASGIYPRRLAEGGLAAALTEQAGKAHVPVDVDAEGIARYAQDLEAAVYFCCLEALQNVAKYASASRVVITLRERDAALTFEVADDGRGFDPHAQSRGTGLQGMTDRLTALGGEIEIASAPGRGTTVTGRVPVAVGGDMRATAATGSVIIAGR